eukprot:jgi/Picsp_1/2283/NSC_05747-R1_binding protein
MNIENDWPSALLDLTENSLKKDAHNVKLSFDAFESAAEKQGLFDLQSVEHNGKLHSVALKAAKLAKSSDSGLFAQTGLQILQVYTRFCSIDYFLENFVEWSNISLSVVKSAGGTKEATWSCKMDEGWNLLFHTIQRLAILSHVKSSKKEGALLCSKCSSAFKQTFDPECPKVSALRTLLACLEGFPSSMKSNEKFLQKCLVGLLWRKNYLQEIAVQCVASLASIEGTSESWGRYCHMLISSAHDKMDTILEGLESDQVMQTYRDQMIKQAPLPSPETGKIKKLHIEIFCDNFCILDGFLASIILMVTKRYSSAVPIPVLGICEVANRALSVDITRLREIEKIGRTPGQVAHLGVRISMLQERAFQMLKSILVAARCAALPFVGCISGTAKGFLESVNSIKESPYADISDSSVLLSALDMLQYLIQIGGQYIINSSVSVVINLSKKVLYLPLFEDLNEKEIANKMWKPFIIKHQYSFEMKPIEVECQVQILKTLQIVLQQGGACLKASERNVVEDMIRHMAHSITQLVEYRSIQAKQRFSILRKIQYAAFEAYLISVIAPSPYRNSHGAEAVQLFRENITCSSQEIASFCQQAILYLESTMHPRSTDLSFKNTSVPENREYSSYGMPVYWSFLEYNEDKKRQLRDAKPDNREKRIKLEEKQTQTESPAAQERIAQASTAAKVAVPTRNEKSPPADLKEHKEKTSTIDSGVQGVNNERKETAVQTQPVPIGQATASMGKPEQQMTTKDTVAEKPDLEKQNFQSVPELPSSTFLYPDSDSDESLPDIDSGNEASDLST